MIRWIYPTIMSGHKDLKPIVKPEVYTSNIASRLSAGWQGETTDRLNDYSVARFDYHVASH